MTALVDEEEFGVRDFEALVDGGKHTLGPLQQQEQQQQEKHELPATDTAESISRRSTQMLNAWSKRLPEVPSIEDLPAVVQAVLPRPLPSPYSPSSTDTDLPVDDVVMFAQNGFALTANFSSIVAIFLY